MQRDSKFMHDIDNGQTRGKKDGGNMCLTISAQLDQYWRKSLNLKAGQHKDFSVLVLPGRLSKSKDASCSPSTVWLELSK